MIDLGVVLACWMGLGALLAPVVGRYLRRLSERYERDERNNLTKRWW